MSISTTSTKVSYDGNNSTGTPYPIPYKYLEDTHVSVYFDGVLKQGGAGADYVLSGDGTTNTGYITTNVAQPATVMVTIVLDVPFDQPVELLETGIMSASTLEEAYDRLNMQIRRVWRKAQGVLTFSTDEGGASTGTADTLLGFDGSGDLGEIPNATFLQTANDLSDVTAATARTNLGVDVAGTDNSTDVTLAGTGTYISIAGQVITVDPIDEADLNASINASLNLADTSIQSLASIEADSLVSTGATVGQVLQADGDDTCSFIDLAGGGNAQTANPLSQFASTTSAQLAGVISDETGTGALVFATSPTLVTPALGTPSAIDLTNATNTPLPASGTVTEAMLNVSTNASLNLADTAIQTETNGTLQGTGATTLNIVAADEGTVASTTARGEGSVDLQTERDAVDQVAEGTNSALIAGQYNKVTGLGSVVAGGQKNIATGNFSFVSGSTNTVTSQRGFVGGGVSNKVLSTNINNAILGGQYNQITGTNSHAVIIGGSDNISSGDRSIAAGRYADDGGFNGARVFGDGSTTPITARQAQEFAIQASALRLEDGNQAVGKVLTCNHADGSSNWAAPAKVVYTVATLPATPAQGDVAMVTDATATAFRSIVAGTGSNIVPVFNDGTNWRIG